MFEVPPMPEADRHHWILAYISEKGEVSALSPHFHYAYREATGMRHQLRKDMTRMHFLGLVCRIRRGTTAPERNNYVLPKWYYVYRVSSLGWIEIIERDLTTSN